MSSRGVRSVARAVGVAVAVVAVAAAVTLAALPGLAAGGGPRDDTPAVWKFRKAIALPPLAAPAFVEVILDADVYGEVSPGLSDLRIRDQAAPTWATSCAVTNGPRPSKRGRSPCAIW